MIYADQRWIGDHGIGRFARNVLAQLDYCPVPLASHPAAPLDAWRLARALGGLTRNDLFFSPGYNTPLYCASPFVFTICDLSHIYCPENSNPMIRLYYATIAKRAAHRAQRILTISEFTRMQIVEWSARSGSCRSLRFVYVWFPDSIFGEERIVPPARRRPAYNHDEIRGATGQLCSVDRLRYAASARDAGTGAGRRVVGACHPA